MNFVFVVRCLLKEHAHIPLHCFQQRSTQRTWIGLKALPPRPEKEKDETHTVYGLTQVASLSGGLTHIDNHKPCTCHMTSPACVWTEKDSGACRFKPWTLLKLWSDSTYHWPVHCDYKKRHYLMSNRRCPIIPSTLRVTDASPRLTWSSLAVTSQRYSPESFCVTECIVSVAPSIFARSAYGSAMEGNGERIDKA